MLKVRILQRIMKKNYFSLLINCLLTGIIIYLAYQKLVVHRPQQQINVNELVLEDENGEIVNWEDFEGQALFINFWASWCGPCLMEMPSIQQLYEQHKNKNITFFIVNTEDAQAVENYEKKKKTGLPHYVLRHSGSIPIKSIPLTYLIDEKGEVKKVVNRTKNWNSPQSNYLIKQLIKN